MTKNIISILALSLLLTSCFHAKTDINTVSVPTPGTNENMSDESDTSLASFFVTSVNPGNGANFGGLTGADAYCQSLADGAGYGDKVWHAYLSTSGYNGGIVTNARDRIGTGPWYNVKGALIASSVEELHSSANRINKETALDENGNMVMGRGDEVNMHDILTGSTPNGTATGSITDTTCSNWTSGDEGSALLGHHDRMGLDESDAAKSWNSSHGSRGCSMDNLKSTGGAGLIYCFAD